MFTVLQAHTILRDILNERLAGFFYEDNNDNPLYNYLDWAQKEIYSECLKITREARLKNPSFTLKALKPMLVNTGNGMAPGVSFLDLPTDFLEIDSIKFMSLIGSSDAEIQEYYPAREVDIPEFNKKESSKYTQASFRSPIYFISVDKINFAPTSAGNIIQIIELNYYKQITTILKASTAFELGDTIKDSLIELAYGKALMMDKKERMGIPIIQAEIKKLRGALQ